MRLPLRVIGRKLRAKAVDQRIAAGLFLDAFDEDARIVKAHVHKAPKARNAEAWGSAPGVAYERRFVSAEGA